MSPTVLPTTGSGISRRSSSMPNASAISRILSSPSSMPSMAKAVLQEMVSASMSDCSPVLLQLEPLKLGMTRELLGSWNSSGAGITVSGVYPSCEGGGRHDHLEDRAGRVDLARRLVAARDRGRSASSCAAYSRIASGSWLDSRVGS